MLCSAERGFFCGFRAAFVFFAIFLIAATEGAKSWTKCANEGDICRMPQIAQVRFGAGDRFVSILSGSGIKCEVTAFGRDPAFGARKVCEFRKIKEEDIEPYGRWNTVAIENGYVFHHHDVVIYPYTTQQEINLLEREFTHLHYVAYGADGVYTHRYVGSTFFCNNQLFGDPIFGKVKECRIREVRFKK